MTIYANVLNVQPTINSVVSGDGEKFVPLAYTSDATPSTLVSLDANGNTSVNSLITGYATTATSGSTTTLTVASAEQQYFTGTGIQTVVLPVTSTLALGQSFTIVNKSTSELTLQSSGANLIQTLAPNTFVIATVISTSGTTAASWSAIYLNITQTISTSTTPVTTTPYNVLNTDQVILVDTGAIAAASEVALIGFYTVDGQEWVIKDSGGFAATYPITVSVGGGGNIDNVLTYVINQNNQAITVCWDSASSKYSIVSTKVDTVTPVTPISITPYVALPSDKYILVDTATIASTCGVTLPGVGLAVDGQTFTVKDWSGAAATYAVNITVDGGLNIDGSNTFTFTENYQSVTVVWNGALSNYSIIAKVTSTASGSTSSVTQTFSASGTYTPTSGMKYCIVEAIGGGGGGSAAEGSISPSNAAAGGGGGGGGYSRITLSATDIGASQAITIGAGGLAGVFGTNDPGVGGTTSLGTLCVAGGGGASLNYGTSAGAAIAQGGDGGSGITGEILSRGSAGGFGFSSGVDGYAYSGAGGSSHYAGSTQINYSVAPGWNGNAHGGGGCGGVTVGVNSSYDGGQGGDGYIIITEYI